MNPPSPAPEPPGRLQVTVFDKVGLGFCAVGVLWTIPVVTKVQPSFAKMFRDFGSELPPFTNMVLKPWFPYVLAIPPLAIVLAGIIVGARRPVRVALMISAIVLTIAAPAVFLVGTYLPIFELAAKIK